MNLLKKMFGHGSGTKVLGEKQELLRSKPSAESQRETAKCDLCSAVIMQGHKIPNMHFRDSVERGFNPLGSAAFRIRMARIIESAAAKGLTDVQMNQRWKEAALVDQSDWVLCDGCYADFTAATERKNRAFTSEFFGDYKVDTVAFSAHT